MSVIYVKEQGAMIRKRGARLFVEKEGAALLELPLRQTDGVALFGAVQVTTQALSMLLDAGIPLALFTRHGRLKGRLVPAASRNVPLRVAQYGKALNESASLELARAVTAAKIANTRTVLEAYRSNYPSEELAETSGRLRELHSTAIAAANHAELLGAEGAAAAAWFRAFATLNRSELPFDGRRKHPAPDPINALLSLGYTFLTSELRGLLETAGFEPHLGFLHRVDYGRPSLALDLVEPFRAFVDRLTLTLVNQRALEAGDFGRSLAGRHAGRVVLLPAAFAKYIARYEAAVTAPRENAPKGIRAAFHDEIDKLRRAIVNDEPFLPWREGADALADLV